MVEREDFAFSVGVEYENLPEFCNVCQNIGHSLSSCKRKNVAGVDKNQEEQDSRSKAAAMVIPVVNRKTVAKFPAMLLCFINQILYLYLNLGCCSRTFLPNSVGI